MTDLYLGAIFCFFISGGICYSGGCSTRKSVGFATASGLIFYILCRNA